MSNMIRVSDGINDEISVFFSTVDQPKAPAIILIHEVWGLTDHIKDVATRLSEAGYNVLAPDLIEVTELANILTPKLIKVMSDPVKRQSKQVELRAMLAPLSSPDFSKETIKKLNICFRFLRHENRVSKIGVVGFCFGGTYSFSLAVNQPELSAAVAFYGHSDLSQAEINEINCPILAFYGRNDALVEKLPELEQRMKAANKNFKYKIYEKTGHAFFNDTNRATYNSKAAKDSWVLALDFLKNNLH